MIVVYTALFGDYDTLQPVLPLPGVRFVAFTDQPADTAGWECLRPRPTEDTGQLENRKYKTQPHLLFPHAEWTIYIDANLRLTVPPTAIARECRDGLNVFQHNVRQCAYREAEVVRKQVSSVTLDHQLQKYRTFGFPAEYGLFWGGLVARNHAANSFNECWWNEVKSGVPRDQISLPYAVWYTGVQCHTLEGGIPFHGDTNRFCERQPHLRS
jgi:hypothetical protein